MPNWCEGSLKIRGPIENIKKFIEEGLGGYGVKLIETKYSTFKMDRSEYFETGKDDFGEWFYFEGNRIYIEETNRAFIDNSAEKNLLLR